MRRLYLQIYLGFLGISLVFFVIASTLWMWNRGAGGPPVPSYLAGVARLIGEQLPAADEPVAALRAAVREHARALDLHISVWSPEGELLAAAGRTLPPLEPETNGPAWIRHRGPPGLAVRLPDSRSLSIAVDPTQHRHGLGWIAILALFAGLIGAGAYPIARRIARRLERLNAAVERLGAGDLAARVPVEGRDEVGELAQSFNRAADRIRALVETQRRLVASASHELRSPLARLRLAVELMSAESRAELRREAETDIAELDALIDDLLVSARVGALDGPRTRETVDLLEIVSEEARRVGADASGDSAVVRGEPRMLRRMIRNLLENARRYGGGGPIEVRVRGPDGSGTARLTVADRGPGVPDSERERIFEPFYRAANHSEGRDGGVGLGLSLVREIARHHGGDARCRARPGGGTRFEVEIGDGR